MYLVIRHQNPFTTVTYLLTISYSTSSKLASKTWDFLGILAAVQSTYFVESLSAPAFVERKFTGEVISGVLKTCKEEDCNLQAYNLLTGNSIRDRFLKIPCKTESIYKKFDQEFKLKVYCKTVSVQLRLEGYFWKFLEELLFETS